MSYKIAAVPVAQCLTISRAEAPGSRDDGERGAAVHRAEVVLHVGCHVGVRGAEGRLAGPGRVRRQADEGDVGDDRAAAQRRRPGEENRDMLSLTATQSRHNCLPPLSVLPHHLRPQERSSSTSWDNPLFLAYTQSEVPKLPVDVHQYCTKYVFVQGGSPQLGCCGKGHELL